MITAYLALGTNRGDRRHNLQRACTLLVIPDVLKIEARSAIYATESVEGGGEGDFLNAAVRITTTLTPRELLEHIREIENRMGRPQPPRQGPRLIDVDILLYGDLKLVEDGLVIPHPRMWRRAFVLRPLCDVLEGGWVRLAGVEWPAAEEK